MFMPGTTLTLDDDAGYASHATRYLLKDIVNEGAAQDVNGLSASVLRELAGVQKQVRAAAER